VAKLYDSIEIGLTRSEVRQALRQWVNAKTSIHDYTVMDFSLHPTSKYMIRFTVEPPLEKSDKAAVSGDLQNATEST
jgi:hypothetical protein